jgi:DNA topoisomerase-2
LKPGQRKILYASLKRNLVHDIKVAQLSGYISEQTMYHHGESSLQSTIVSMAQGFVGTNNIPLFEPVGQFGTRHLGGSDAASARYIYTKLSPFARSIFHPSDDPILEYTEEDGIKVEPNHYVPVIPMALVNGSYGIGTGYMTSVPNYNPLDIIRNIKAKLKGKSQNPLRPYYRNFKGEIETIDASKGKFNTVGLANWVGNSHFVHITELPIGVWTQNYKTNVLEKLANVDGLIRQVNELHTDEFVNFKVALTNQGVDLAKQVGLVNLLKLSHKHSVSFCIFFRFFKPN